MHGAYVLCSMYTTSASLALFRLLSHWKAIISFFIWCTVQGTKSEAPNIKSLLYPCHDLQAPYEAR